MRYAEDGEVAHIDGKDGHVVRNCGGRNQNIGQAWVRARRGRLVRQPPRDTRDTSIGVQNALTELQNQPIKPSLELIGTRGRAESPQLLSTSLDLGNDD